MDFTIPEELVMIQKLARKFIQEELLPLEKQVEETGEFPEEIRRRFEDEIARPFIRGIWEHIPEEVKG